MELSRSELDTSSCIRILRDLWLLGAPWSLGLSVPWYFVDWWPCCYC